ncbi:MAG: NUDIX domain-containing protein [Acidobacteria bacterium]|nr:NUDIX domain-containing protein [Acidobacteriota bacterium]
MATPEFILDLRVKIGTDLLWLPGVGGAVLDEDNRVLLCQRSDNKQWTLITGILDPGEEPAAGIVREVEEETGVLVVPERIVSVTTHGPVTFPNGDRTTFLSVVFRCRYISGEARVNDDENDDVRWFLLDDLPELSPRHLADLQLALAPEEPAHFTV